MKSHAILSAALCTLIGNPVLAGATGTEWTATRPAQGAETSAQRHENGGTQSGTKKMQNHPYIGMWITGDGQVRQQLKADGRYAEARGERENAYTGRYRVEGNAIQYWDDSGFTADGEFVDGVLYHGGMVMRRQEVEQ